MSATTIKLESKLLEDIRRMKRTDQSITSYVKEILEREIRRQHAMEGARQYRDFLNQDTKEAAMLQEWETASLDRAPKPTQR